MFGKWCLGVGGGVIVWCQMKIDMVITNSRLPQNFCRHTWFRMQEKTLKTQCQEPRTKMPRQNLQANLGFGKTPILKVRKENRDIAMTL